MKSALVAAGLAAVLLLGPGAMRADAAGCLKGAVVGGVAGHFVGHHGLIGAGVGCLVGRHEANKAARERAVETRTRTTTVYGR